MGFLEEIAKLARRELTNDGWYYKQEPYLLEIKTSVLHLTKSGFNPPSNNIFMELPLGPEQYTVTRTFRQSVTPTLGALIAEERGLLWKIVNIQGSFGLKPKIAFDTSLLGPDDSRVVGLGNLSGPGWTRRMMRNYFDKYAALKADPTTSADTQMIWHDIKTDNHWVVVPEEVTIDRTVARRFQYPYTIRLKVIADADALVADIPLSQVSDLVSAANNAAAGISAVNKGLALVNSAIQEASAFLGEVRFFVATIDSITDKMTTISQSAQDFVDGVTATISVGATFVSSTALRLQEAVDLIETVAELPDAVRQNYMLALDGLDALTAQKGAYGTTYQQEAAAIGSTEAGAAGESRATLAAQQTAGPPGTVQELENRRGRSSDVSLVDNNAIGERRSFANYAGFRDYVIQSTDTLQSIAAKQLGDGALWYDIAIVNGLRAPYITPQGSPGTVKPGARIAIPTTAPTSNSNIASGAGSEPGLDALGTDIKLVETALSVPGRPKVDIAIDQRTFKDFATISGIANLGQALQMRTWTERGTLPLAPLYGLPRAIGIRNTGTFASLFRLAYRETMSQDSRVQQIRNIRIRSEEDVLEIESDVQPVGLDTTRSISTAII